MICGLPKSKGKARASCLIIILTGFMVKEVKHTHNIALCWTAQARCLERKESSHLCGVNFEQVHRCVNFEGFFLTTFMTARVM